MQISSIPKPCCTALTAYPVDNVELERLASHLRSLADPSRLAIVSILSAAGCEVCVCDLEEHLDLSQPTVSHHLRILHEAGVVGRRRQGRWAYYSLRPEVLDSLGETLERLGS